MKLGWISWTIISEILLLWYDVLQRSDWACHWRTCKTFGIPRWFYISQVAAEFGHPSIVEALLQHGAKVDGQHAKGRATALMLSAKCGHLRVLNELLSHGATVDLGDVKGRQALHHAAIGGHHLVAKSLLRASAEVYCHDTCGRTPLHLATLALNETWWMVDRFSINALWCKNLSVLFKLLGAANSISSKEWSNEVWCRIDAQHVKVMKRKRTSLDA